MRLVGQYQSMSRSKDNDEVVAEIVRIAMAVHYYAVYQMSKQSNLTSLSAKVAITLLRSASSLIPADKAYYLAGQACRDVGHNHLAFLFWNR